MSPYTIAKVPFPFTDRQTRKRRPALVLSSIEFGEQSGHSVMAMVTSARHSEWPLDVRIKDRSAAGLPTDCVIRMKLFTLDHRLVLGAVGRLSESDRESVESAISRLLPAME